MIVILVFGMVITGCQPSPAPTTVNVNPYNPNTAPPDTLYCKYTIANVTGPGAHQVGDTICVVCTYECPSERVIVPAEGIEYFLKIESLVSCQTCNDVDVDKFYENR